MPGIGFLMILDMGRYEIFCTRPLEIFENFKKKFAFFGKRRYISAP
jgi:hypothetical protein